MLSITALGHTYQVQEPKGSAAIELFAAAMAVFEESGARKALEENHGAVSVAARLLAGNPKGTGAAMLTLKGATCDGALVDGKAWIDSYAQGGRFAEPYIVALIVWDRLGFLRDGDGSPAVPQ